MKKRNIVNAIAIGALGLVSYFLLKDNRQRKGLPDGHEQEFHLEETSPKDFVQKQKDRKSTT